MPPRKLVVLVHGWSVKSTDTYGKLADRLEREQRRDPELDLDIKNIWLGKYVSFRDEIRVEDLARAFQAAVEREIKKHLAGGRRFACITHSTGGPVVREWFLRFWVEEGRAHECPMSHLIMLAPANFGSALAQLGKSRLSRIKTFVEGVEPGSGVLDWLELGSPESWELNCSWIRSRAPQPGERKTYFFVLTGQSIDRSLYDHLNSYTGETGSDGVVRAAGANLNACHVRLVQEPARPATKEEKKKDPKREWVAPRLELDREASARAQRTAFAVLGGRAHSGKDMGILRSIRDDGKSHPTVDAVLACLRVAGDEDYERLCDEFDSETAAVQERERVERQDRFLLPDTYAVHDRYSMLIFRLRDDHEHVVGDFDLLMIAGKEASPDLLPKGFFVDRQRNSRHRGTVTYYLNHDVTMGADAVVAGNRLLRDASPGAEQLGLEVHPRPQDGFVHYLMAQLDASRRNLQEFVRPNETTLIDIVLRRLVRQGSFGLTLDRKPRSFKDEPPGPPLP